MTLETFYTIDAIVTVGCLAGMLILGCHRAGKHFQYWRENLDDLTI